ncbi:DUF6566 family protein [Paraburkholderia sp. PGU19]|uniref:DUF6566 family protein n=1 Tax=Paraburkholderia sp. PGU19 TaxID=2735434 RepID=UPI0031F913B5
MADITRQLAGSAAVETGFVEAPRASDVAALTAASALDAGVVFSDVQRFDVQAVQAVQAPMQARAADSYAASVQADAHGEDASSASASADTLADSASDSQRTPLWMSLTAPRGLQVADRQGYTIYVEAEQVPNDAFRAWAEIMKDGKRVERSGLIGPRFADVDAAHRFALDWARQWIDRECRTAEAAAGLHANPLSVGMHMPKVAVRPVTRAMPELTPTPALAAANVVAATGNPHLPQHLNPRLMPLRRYPSEVAKDNKTGERYPMPSNLLWHAG